MNRYSEMWRIVDTLDKGYPILISFRQVRQKRLSMGYVDSQWHILHNNGIWSRMTCLRKWWPAMIKNIKFERVSPLQVRIEGPHSSISGTEWRLSETWLVKCNLEWLIMVQYLSKCRDMIDSGHICPCINFFEQFSHFLSVLIIIRSKCQVSAKVARNGV